MIFNWIPNLCANVVFPEDDGPAIKTIFTPFLSAILSAICEIFFSCKASELSWRALLSSIIPDITRFNSSFNLATAPLICPISSLRFIILSSIFPFSLPEATSSRAAVPCFRLFAILRTTRMVEVEKSSTKMHIIPAIRPMILSISALASACGIPANTIPTVLPFSVTGT